MKLFINIEKNGEWVYVGSIEGNSYLDARFCYDLNYIGSEDAKPISISLPFKEECFSVTQTRNFFEGLLPEGFTRRAVAGFLHVDENDYLQLLKNLGKECIGAIKVSEADNPPEKDSYEKLSIEDIKALASEGASKSSELILDSHLSLAGASGKVGLLFYNNKWYLPKGSAPSNYIVKQSHIRLNNIVLNEQFCQIVANKLGVDVPPSMIIDIESGNDNELLFGSRRYDRCDETSGAHKLIDNIPAPARLHQEDFAQALGIAAAQKYEANPNEHYLKKMFDLIRMYSSNPLEDQLKLWNLTIINFLIGNTDNHIKNSSLLYSPDMKSIRLAPCYDIISTTLYGNRTGNMAYSINGKYQIKDIDRDAFAEEANAIGLGNKVAMQHYDDIKNRFYDVVNETAKELESINPAGIQMIKEHLLKNS